VKKVGIQMTKDTVNTMKNLNPSNLKDIIHGAQLEMQLVEKLNNLLKAVISVELNIFTWVTQNIMMKIMTMTEEES